MIYLINLAIAIFWIIESVSSGWAVLLPWIVAAAAWFCAWNESRS